ncbi:protein of unknown function [Taphrina deformans PYCC 5710]|uniref:glucan 1,3-beta-glucosidase n=1 Tax=Taphrina deformans (strain PYCC 5710 / ATCC 11124 / CBS 356.35 / IMI 108563 / JCM 9778 / NBRC 8474) TaxID=1097556 RepID=R4XN54_TAPDE|nr:protein of unknown function [Taphrina deformans PYCC 5710]|eukprot:CCG84674.1 protein of unknown function [Taphrina deformans PYCC 5710]
MILSDSEKKSSDTRIIEEQNDLNWPLPLQNQPSFGQSKHWYRRRWKIILAITIALIITVLILALGLHYGLQSHQSMSNLTVADGHGQSTEPTSPGKSSSAQTCSSALRDSFSSPVKWQGVNLGNWLILERWMNPTYYSFYTGISQTDEWSFCQSLGDSCGETLENHWTSWISSQEIEQLALAGFNILRVPIGFWAFIAPEPWEPYHFGSQTNQLTRILSYAKSYNMSVIIDLHGLPGSQNGYEHSGHEGEINFFNSTNQARSVDLIDAVVAYVRDSAYLNQIVAIEVANEPKLGVSKNLSVYKQYLQSAHSKITSMNAAINRNITMMFHDGFVGASQFDSIFGPCDTVVVDYHQYFFSTGATRSATQNAVCAAQSMSSSHLRVFYGEWSLSSNYQGDANWSKSFFETQASIYANTTGSAFWSFKTYGADGTGQNSAWSVQGLLEDQIIPSNSTWSYVNSFC